MIRGLQLAMDLVHADKGVIAIKAIHGDAVRALQQAIADDDRLALHFCPISILLGKNGPSSGKS